MILGGRQVQVSATVHPSSILRAPDEEAREREFEAFVADLSAVASPAGLRQRLAWTVIAQARFEDRKAPLAGYGDVIA